MRRGGSGGALEITSKGMVLRSAPNLGFLLLSVAAVTAACAISACDGHRGAISAPGAAGTDSSRSLQPSAGKKSESPPPASPYLADTWSGIHAFQPFDNFANKNIITPEQAARDGPLYVAVWGSNSGTMVHAWQTNNPTIVTSYYIQIGVDALTDQFGNLGHALPWWKANHPDWILYECDKTTVALVPGIPQIPLDISNPLVVQYLENLVGPYAEQNGYAAIGADFAQVNNPTGGRNGGTHGCGVWTVSQGQPLWVQKFSGASRDPAWASAVMSWLTSFGQYAHSQPRPLALWGNLDLGGHNTNEAQEKQLLALLDIANDETGYTKLGGYGNSRYITNTTFWIRYIQSLGKGVLVADLFNDNPITNGDIDFAIATYLLSKEQASALFAAPYGTYGLEHYYPAYAAAVGAPCAEWYGGPTYKHLGQQVFYRQYEGALALANASDTTAYTVTLPKPSYTDAVTGGTITSPLTVNTHSGFVLLTSNGCGP
jgi:hypothetical protein